MANLNIAIEILAKDRASGPLGRISSALGGVSKVGGVLATGATAIVAGLVGISAAGTGMATNMESSLSAIAADMNKTKEEIAPLGNLIKDLGLDPNLKVTSDEAAAAIHMLAKNGLDMTQILDGAAHSTVLLANATGTDFGNAANIGTDAMSIFNIEAKNMGDAVNGITSVTQNSKFTIDDYALALAQGGGVAAAVGVSFDDFNTTIAAISPLFKSGSDAGTSLKTMLTRLIPSSSAAEEAMADLGIITENGANQFFDAEGNMKNMADIAGVLSGALADLSEEQKTQYLNTIFGADAMRAAVGLADTGEEAFRDLAAQMGETDALESAATRMDNLAGVMEILEGIGESLMLTVGNGLLPIFRLFADNALALAERVLPQVEAGIALVADVVGNFANNLAEGMSPLDAFIEAIWNIAPPGLLASLVDLRDNILPGLIAQVTEFLEPIRQWIGENIKLSDVLTAVGIAISAVIIPALIGVVTAAAPIILTFVAIVGAVALVRTAWEENWGGIQEKTQSVITFIQNLITTVMTGIQTFWAEHGDTILAKAEMVWELIQNTYENATIVIQDIFAVFQSLFEGNWYEFGQNLFALWEDSWTLVTEFMSGYWELIKPELLKLWIRLSEWWNGIDWRQLGRNVVDGIVAGIRAAGDAIKNTLRGIIDGAIQSIRERLGISSPSKLTAEIIGKPMAQGVAVGWTQYLRGPQMEMGLVGALPTASPATSSGFGGVKNVFNIDARRSAPGVAREIRQEVEAILRQHGMRADVRMRS